MGNRVQILNKIARDLAMLGLTVTSNDGVTVVIANSTNFLSITYDDAVIQAPLGGVSPAVSPFLGIGIANPGTLVITCALHAADTIAEFFDTVVPVQVVATVAGFANDFALKNAGGVTLVAVVRASADLRGLGQ